jgi:hypothetical protein
MKKYSPVEALKVPLTAYEQAIEDAIDENAPPQFADPEVIRRFRQAAVHTLQEMRGGARPGAGRKSRPHVRTTVLLEPKLRRKLERLAKQQGSLSAAVEMLVRNA